MSSATAEREATMQVQTLTLEHDDGVQKWDVFYTQDEKKTFPTHAEGLEKVKAVAEVFPKEDTWVQREHGIPSLIKRIDGIIDPEDGLVIFEVEERPAGIGIAREINSDFRRRFDELRETWPYFESISPLGGHTRDDRLWVPIGNPNTNGRLVIIRSEPHEEEVYHHIPYSVSTVKEEGNKSYGEKLGWWTKVTFEELSDPGSPYWNTSFVLKPKQSSKSFDVVFWHNVRSKDKVRGASTKTKILETLQKHGSMYLQKFYLPMLSDLPPDQFGNTYKFMIYRVFYGYDLIEKVWKYLGGMWAARNNVKIHGAGDTLFGPVVVE